MISVDLPAPVVADQADDLATVDAEIDPAQRVDLTVGLADVAQFDDAFGHRILA
nr:hypothetical protein [Mesorhizobium sp.]